MQSGIQARFDYLLRLLDNLANHVMNEEGMQVLSDIEEQILDIEEIVKELDD